MAEYKAEEGQLKEVSSILKALLTSFGGELPMDQINGEYRNQVGVNIPFREFKHGSLASFLQSIPSALKLENRCGRLVVVVVADANIDLILHQVRGQNNTKMQPKKKFTNYNTSSQPTNPRWQKNTNWYPIPPVHTQAKEYMAHTNPQASRWGNTNPQHPYTNPQRPYTNPQHPYTNPQRPYTNSPPELNPQASQWGHTNPQRPVKTPPPGPPPGFETTTHPTPGPQPTSNPPPMAKAPASQGVATHTGHLTTISEKEMVTVTEETKTKPAVAEKNETEGSLKTEAPLAEKTEKSFKQQLIELVKELEGRTDEDWGNLNLTFKTSEYGKNKEWYSVVMLGEAGKLKVSSYPNLSSTGEEAEEAASQKALEQLAQVIQSRKDKQCPATTDMQLGLARVKQLLKERAPNKRFWWEALTEVYREVYNERLPYYWLPVLTTMKTPGLVFDNPCVDKWTVALTEESQDSQSANKPQDTTPTHTHSSQQNGMSEATNTTTTKPAVTTTTTKPAVTTTTTEPPATTTEPAAATTLPGQKPQLPSFILPLTPTWDVFVTCLEGGNNIHLVLINKKFHLMYSELQTDMELHYMEEKNQESIEDPEVEGVYVASHEESWLRVRVVELLGDEVKVKVLDHGETETIPRDSLYRLEDKFFALAPQSLWCCLSGLEDAPEEATYQALMHCLPMHQTLVARVQRRQQPYALVLFDTSTDNDINLNDKVLDYLAEHMEQPKLPPEGGIVEVYLSSAEPDGTIYIQVESKTFKILQDLRRIAKRCTEEILGDKNPVDLLKLYLARYSKDGEWYRAAPRTAVDVNGKVLMRFVDYGYTEKVPLSDMKGLQKLSVLSKIPRQALPCRLHNVPNTPDLRWTKHTCQRLVDLAPPDIPLLLKVVSDDEHGRHPIVQLFKRLSPLNQLVSINDTLSMETALFRPAVHIIMKEGDSNNNSSEEREVVVRSQVRSPQPSRASGLGAISVAADRPSARPSVFPSCSPLPISYIPNPKNCFDVYVTYAANPHHFAVQPWAMGRDFDDLCESMETHYRNPVNLKCVKSIKSGQYCAIKHTDGTWYRAKVERVVDGSVTGMFVDFGDCFISSLDKVQPLIPAFSTLPCLAIKAELVGIEAANRDWSPEDACRFRELAQCKNFVSTVHGKKESEDGSLFLSLVLIDTSDKIVDINIHKVLVEERRARAVCKNLLQSRKF